MKSHNSLEVQAIMNLLYIGNEDDAPDFSQTLAKREFTVLQNHHNKIKSNTLHLRNTKKGFHPQVMQTQTLGHSHSCKKNHIDNKENLKKLLEKWENAPSPPPKKKEQVKKQQTGRAQTQTSEPLTKSKPKSLGNNSLELTKKSLDMFFEKKKDRDFVKSLIKAKIIDKLRKAQITKHQRKVYPMSSNCSGMRALGCRPIKQSRHSVQPNSKSKEKSNVLNILWQQKKINKPVVSRQSSRVNLKQLLF